MDDRDEPRDGLGDGLHDGDTRREAAVKRVKAKKDFKNHVAIYVIVNTMLVVIWALSGQGYFWPVWTIVGWGIGLAFNAWAVYFEKPITEDDIRREMESGSA
jgi:uncharacterized ion transporter superfamily protein YfcC